MVDRAAMENVQGCEDCCVNKDEPTIPIQQYSKSPLGKDPAIEKQHRYLNGSYGGPIEYDVCIGCLEKVV